MTNTMKENKNTDAVAQARDLVLATMFVGNMPDFEYYSGDPRWEPAVSQCKAENEERLNALIAAVRAECSEQAVTEAQCRRICEVLGKTPDERVSDHGGLLQHAAAVERGETLYETFDILTITEAWRLVRAAYVIAAPPATEAK